MFWLPENEDVKKRYVEGVGKEVKERIKDKLSQKIPQYCEQILRAMLDETSDFYYEKILGMKPDEMMDFYVKWSEEFKKNCKSGSIYGVSPNYRLYAKSGLSKVLKKCFDYTEFSKKNSKWEWNAYRLGKELGVEVCPYCGRQFISTVIVGKKQGNQKELKVLRAEFDHYIPKAKFPMFALSFYNLIPSCHFCNSSIKNVKELSTQKNIHPYQKTGAEVTFRYDRVKKEIKLDFRNDDGRLKSTCKFFRLEEIYQSHTGIAERYMKEAQEFSTGLLEEYKNFLEKNLKRKVSKKEILFRKFRIPDDIENEILGKFRKDIVEDIVEKYK